MLGPGSRIGGLVIDSVIGRGAMGEVYRATQLSLKRKVAVKRIADHLLAHPEAVARFEREAQCLARVHSANVIAVHDFAKMRAEDGSDHFLLVMELVEGGRSLRHYIGRAMDWRQATSLAQQVAEGLAAAAEFGVVHRDVKPDNIMLNSKGLAKLADFGLARTGDSTDMTVAGSVLGTPAYMSPEACRGEEVDARSDIYALGATWYHLLTGRTPFQASNAPAMLLCHIDDQVPPIASLTPGVPEEIAELVLRCLAKDPAQRPASARAVVEELRALAVRGIVIPATVPELVASLDTPTDPATAETNMITPRTGAADSGTAPTMLQPVSEPGAAAPPRRGAQQRTRGRGPLLIGGLVLALALVAAIAWSLHDDPIARATREVDAALAAGDTEFALRRADALVARLPDPPQPRALARKAVAAEVGRITAAARFDDARRRLTELRQTRTWLDDAELARDIDLAEAHFHAHAGRFEDAARIYTDLRKRYPLDLAVCGPLVDDLATSEHQAMVLDASLQIADSAPGPLPKEVLGSITRSFHSDGPFSELAKRLRAALIAHDPGFVERMRAQIASDDPYERMNAYAALVDAKAVSPEQELRYHLKNLLELSSSYSVADQAVEYIRAASSAPDWAKRKRSAGVGPITQVKAFESNDEHAQHVAELLTSALRDESRQLLVTWATADDAFAAEHACQRVIAFRALRAAGLTDAAALDPWAFHARTLRTFYIGGDAVWFTDAVEFFRTQIPTRPDEAKAVLEQCAARIQVDIDGYIKAGLDLHTRAPRRELQTVRDAIAGKPAAP